MKNIQLPILCFLFLGLFTTLQAQEKSPNSNIREIGLRLPSLQDFGFIYKKQKSPNRYIRHRLAIANIAIQNINNENSGANLRLGYAVGIENRKPLGKNIFFTHGIEPSLNLSFASQNGLRRMFLQPAIGYVIGFQLEVVESFYINIETVPIIRGDLKFYYGDRANAYSMVAGFSLDAVAVTFAYRFALKE